MKRFTPALAVLALSLCIAAVVPAFAANVKGNVPYREDSGLTKAEYFIARGKYAEAIDEASAVIDRHPKSADAYTYRGVAYLQLGDAKKARADFKRAIAANPSHLGANKYLADILLRDGQVAQAVEQLQVLRAVCGGANCEEVDDLERDINKAKGRKTPGYEPATREETANDTAHDNARAETEAAADENLVPETGTSDEKPTKPVRGEYQQ